MTTCMPAPPCLVNLRCLGHHVTGVQRYVLGLLPHLQGCLDTTRPTRVSQGIFGHAWEQFILPGQTRGRLLWSPANTGPLAVERQVVTVHDAATLDHPEWFEGKFARWYRFMLPRLMHKVRRVVTVSEFSRRRLIETASLPEEQVVAIHNGVDPRLQPVPAPAVADFLRRRDHPLPYLLCVASLEPRKNLRRLFTAWEHCRLPGDGLELVVAGAAGGVFRDRGFERLPAGVRLLGHVGEDELPCLYTGAHGFIFPSVYEGFGLPPLEAMACGCPVLTSHAASLPEVCGPEFRPDQPDHSGAPLYFDPFDPESIAAGIVRLLQLTPAQRQAMTANGLRRAAQFSWQRAAEQTWQVLSASAA